MKYPFIPSRNTAIFILLFSLILTTTIEAEYLQQGGKLIGSGNSGPANEGTSVALSADGNTAIIGGPGDSVGLGAAWVFVRANGAWSQQGTKLVGSGAVSEFVHQGYAVALSGDGNTAIIGGPGDDSAGLGAAWVFVRAHGVWSQQGGKLVGSGAISDLSVKQGWSVSLSGDGNTAIVGGWGDSLNTGAAWVWTRTGEVWSQQGGKLVGTGATDQSEQGFSVSISGDGNTAIVAGDLDNDELGATWVWTRAGGVWSQHGDKLVGSVDALHVDHQGWSSALASDGNTAIIGGPTDSGGKAWVWKQSGGIWSQQGGTLTGSGNSGPGRQGASVALSADGNIAVVGSPTDHTDSNAYSVGAAWVWTRSGELWTQQGGKLIGSGDSLNMARQGASVAISADGNTIIVGGPIDSYGIGAAWIFTQNSLPILPMKSSHPKLTLVNGTSLHLELLQNGKVSLQIFNAKGQIHSSSSVRGIFRKP